MNLLISHQVRYCLSPNTELTNTVRTQTRIDYAAGYWVYRQKAAALWEFPAGLVTIEKWNRLLFQNVKFTSDEIEVDSHEQMDELDAEILAEIRAGNDEERRVEDRNNENNERERRLSADKRESNFSIV